MSLLEQQLQTGTMYARLPIYKKRLSFAVDGIRVMNSIAPLSYLSLSFGKQSICLAHMIYGLYPDTPMFFLASSESWIVHNFFDVIDEFMSKWSVNLTIVQTNRLGLDISRPILRMSEAQPAIKWIFRGWEAGQSWEEARALGHKDLQEMCSIDEWDGLFMGLAKEESKGRRITLSYRWPGQPHPAIFRYKSGKFRCCPLTNWGIDEIAAYVGTHNIKLLSEYNNGLQARTTARITGMTASEGGIALMKHRDIAALNELAAKFPELRSFT